MNIISTISRRSGTEGSRHDPYSYEEYTITRNDESWLLHEGLSTFIKRGDGALFIPPDMAGALDAALKAAGCPLTERQIKKYYDRIRLAPLKMHKSHGGTDWSEGHPGEELLICKCGSVLDSSFDLSAIE
jgi:hypothetical protein